MSGFFAPQPAACRGGRLVRGRAAPIANMTRSGMSDEAKIKQLVERAWDEGQSINMGHLSERDRGLVCEAIVDLIEVRLPRLKKRTGRPYVLIVRDHHQLRVELRER